jgi:hypothetical protein
VLKTKNPRATGVIAIMALFLSLTLSVSAQALKDSPERDGRAKRNGRISRLLMRDEVMKKQLFQGQELLGRPTDSSMTINAVIAAEADVFYEYGTASGKYPQKTMIQNSPANIPIITVLDGLQPDGRYFYRMNYRIAGKGFTARHEHSFHTRRNQGSAFTFVVEADPHLDENCEPERYRNALKHMGTLKADFLIDLGDTCMSDKLEEPAYESVMERALLFRNYFDTVCHSLPLFLVLGNHEGEAGWPDRRSNNQIASWNEKARMCYFLNPLPDRFYSGNPERKGNYYAFTWGDALFVMIDPYRYTREKPGRRNSDNWAWTLGEIQYRWLRATLEKSSARHKFVFSHQLVGGDDRGRGGVEFVPFYEWGGLNQDGTDGFEGTRPGWGKPIHKLFVDTEVDLFFHGHDHLFARQELDGVIYQAVPQPGSRDTGDPGYAREYGYREGIIQGNSGYLRVTVSPDNVKVDYIRASCDNNCRDDFRNGDISYSYTLKPKNR